MTDEPEFDDDAPYAGTQILWGRVLVLLSALALAFWLGTTFGGDDGSRREIREQADEIARLQAQIAGLEAEIEARDAAAAETSEEASAVPSEVASPETSQRQGDQTEPTALDLRAEIDGDAQSADGQDGAQAADDRDGAQAADDRDGAQGRQQRQERQEQQDEPRGRRYVVQSGDSLAAIAQEVYGDPTQWRTIARANDLREPYSLTVGEALRIPPSP